jgi:hypothetical protein
LVARSGGLGHQNATENGMLNAELSHLRRCARAALGTICKMATLSTLPVRSRFPSLQSRGSSSRGGIRLGTGQDGRRSREANSREGRTTHAADISQTAEAARAGPQHLLLRSLLCQLTDLLALQRAIAWVLLKATCTRWKDTLLRARAKNAACTIDCLVLSVERRTILWWWMVGTVA